ncbi:hypothetical protein B0H13DRAFT_1851900 [Mycena leptocephala]|nr:hypothetical protein B0H13DRAFT_1851900 [Mycena leptocephala]
MNQRRSKLPEHCHKLLRRHPAAKSFLFHRIVPFRRMLVPSHITLAGQMDRKDGGALHILSPLNRPTAPLAVPCVPLTDLDLLRIANAMGLKWWPQSGKQENAEGDPEDNSMQMCSDGVGVSDRTRKQGGGGKAPGKYSSPLCLTPPGRPTQLTRYSGNITADKPQTPTRNPRSLRQSLEIAGKNRSTFWQSSIIPRLHR